MKSPSLLFSDVLQVLFSTFSFHNHFPHRNDSRLSYGDSDCPPASRITTLDDNPCTKSFSNINFQGSRIPSGVSSYFPKRDKTPPALHPNERKKDYGYDGKKRSDMSLESPERFNGGGEDEKSLRAELQDTKSKMKVITTKLTTMRKERDQLQKDNKILQEEVLSLQSSLRQMIPGFANTSCSFPMLNELIGNAAEFYKCECEDIFFDVLCPELRMKGVIFFFQTAFMRLVDTVNNYFRPSEDALRKTGCLEALEGPLMNSLRKCYQSKWKEILEKCLISDHISGVAGEIQGNLKLGKMSSETRERIEEFLYKMGELVLCFYISDPPLVLNCETIGSKVMFNPIKHEPMDGFIKAKDECIVILPSVHKNAVEGEIVGKALVLQVGYEILN